MGSTSLGHSAVRAHFASLPGLLALLLALLPLAAGNPTWLRSPKTGGGSCVDASDEVRGGGAALVLAHACENDYTAGVVAAVLSARAGGWAGRIVLLTAGVGDATVAAFQEAGATDVLLFDRDFYTPGGWQDPAEFARLGFDSPHLCKQFGLQLKLYAFSLTTFSKLLIIDSDVVVLGNLTGALDLPVTSVCGGGCQLGEMLFEDEAQTRPLERRTPTINAGVILALPSQLAYLHLMMLWVSLRDPPILPEQAIINMLYGHMYEKQVDLQTAWNESWISAVRDVFRLPTRHTPFGLLPCSYHVKGSLRLPYLTLVAHQVLAATEAEQSWAFDNMVVYHFTNTKPKEVLSQYRAHQLPPLGDKVFGAWLGYDAAARRLLNQTR